MAILLPEIDEILVSAPKSLISLKSKLLVKNNNIFFYSVEYELKEKSTIKFLW